MTHPTPGRATTMRVVTPATRTGLTTGFLDRVDQNLRSTDALLAESFPGDDGRRQPVHTVYVPGDRFTADLPRQWGDAARRAIADHGGVDRLCALVGLDEQLAAEIAPLVDAKLTGEPVEDLRIDFEDGYGDRGQDAEDADVVAAATSLGDAVRRSTAPPFVGIRFKCFEAPTRRRGLRTLDLFLGTLLDHLGALPEGLMLTLPKVSTVTQVHAMVAACEELERANGLPAGRLGFEIQVETPQLIIGPDGRIPIAEAVHAAAGRVTALHYGTYDYSASLQISAEYQASDHPAADFAKQVMQIAVAGTGVHLSDGSTNILPVGESGQVEAAWRLHAGLVRRALERGFYQGWDMHAHQLPTRYIATFAFYRAGWARAAARLSAYLDRVDSAILDEPATAKALARYLQRGVSCGAVQEAELVGAGVAAGDLGRLAGRRTPAPPPAAAGDHPGSSDRQE
jgi:citrate lyase beta subunit